MKKTNLSPVERVYHAFYLSNKKRMYFNEIRQKTGMSISSLQNAIKSIEKSDEIIKIKEKGNAFYQLKDNEKIALNYTKFDIIRLESLNRNVKIPIKEFIEKIGKVVYVLMFGSAASGQEKKGSDIDTLIVTYHFDDKKLNELYQKHIKDSIEKFKKSVNAKSLYPLSLVFIDEEEFKIRKDYLLDEAKKTGFCIYNQLNYHKEALKHEN